MNRLPWICARRENVFEMSGRIDGPATGGQTPWRSAWRRVAQSTHACKRRTLTSSRGVASCGDAGVARGARAAGERSCAKGIKEKLQSLTSQMLLTRLGRAVTQALMQGVDKLLNANMR